MTVRKRTWRKLAVSWAVIGVGVFGVLPAGAAQPRAGVPAQAGSDVEKTQVCFVVHNPGGPVNTAPQLVMPADPTPQAIIADRYASTTTDPNKVIVLEYGASGNKDYWDFRPDFSVARNLARAGYLVFAPDLLGHGYSTYPYPQRATVTTEGQREMLHEEVEQIRGLSVVAAGERDPCAGRSRSGAGPAPEVALVSHSAGGFVVNGYPAKYRPPDPGHVDAIIEASPPVQCGATSPGAATVCVGTRLGAVITERTVSEAGREWSPFLADGSIDPYKSWRYPTSAIDPATCLDNKHILFWDGATDADAYLSEACNPANFETQAYTETISSAVDNVKDTPASLPALFIFMDHDNAVPGASNSPDNVWCNSVLPPGDEGCQQPTVTFWKQNCPCSALVSSWILTGAGHGLVWDKRMPAFTEEVATWLSDNGMRPRSSPNRDASLAATR